MYEYLVQNPPIAIIFIVLIGTAAFIVVTKTMQVIGLERIRKIVYKGFVNAEHAFQHGDNTAKFEYVINLAKASLPMPFSLFITESLLRSVIQTWFDLCKDLLDDGKMNGTGKDGEE